MTRRRARALAAAALLLLAACAATPGRATTPTAPPTPPPLHTGPPPPSAEPFAAHATLQETEIDGHAMAFCTNGALAAGAQAERVVVVVHGLNGNACEVADAVLAGAGPRAATTLVIAPQFATPAQTGNDPTRLAWATADWPTGNPASNPAHGPSSFTVLDDLIAAAHPAKLVVAGFSGGGQFVERYLSETSVAVDHYLVADPSTYLYWSKDRPGTPAIDLAQCPSYNAYRYGLDDLNPVMAAVGPQQLRENFAARRVTYLLGALDKDPRSPSMDKSCGAEAQGPNRLVRGQRFFATLGAEFGPGIYERQHLIVVDGVDHNPVQMFTAPATQAEIFS